MGSDAIGKGFKGEDSSEEEEEEEEEEGDNGGDRAAPPKAKGGVYCTGECKASLIEGLGGSSSGIGIGSVYTTAYIMDICVLVNSMELLAIIFSVIFSVISARECFLHLLRSM